MLAGDGADAKLWDDSVTHLKLAIRLDRTDSMESLIVVGVRCQSVKETSSDRGGRRVAGRRLTGA